MIDSKCPDCGYDNGLLNPVTMLTMDDEVLERKLQCPNCWHTWAEKPGEETRQTSLRKQVIA